MYNYLNIVEYAIFADFNLGVSEFIINLLSRGYVQNMNPLVQKKNTYTSKKI